MPRRRPAMNTAFGVVFSLAAICSTPSLPRAISMTSRSLFIDRPISVGFRWLERCRYAGGEHSCQRVMTVESLAARACHHAVRFLGRHQFARSTWRISQPFDPARLGNQRAPARRPAKRPRGLLWLRQTLRRWVLSPSPGRCLGRSRSPFGRQPGNPNAPVIEPTLTLPQ
jgi:hypothetical protein